MVSSFFGVFGVYCSEGMRSLRCMSTPIGGGKKCAMEGCSTSAVSRGHCVAHGGGKRCQHQGCRKSAQTGGLCWYAKWSDLAPRISRVMWVDAFTRLHGGGKKCGQVECPKRAQSGGFCIVHGTTCYPVSLHTRSTRANTRILGFVEVLTRVEWCLQVGASDAKSLVAAKSCSLRACASATAATASALRCAAPKKPRRMGSATPTAAARRAITVTARPRRRAAGTAARTAATPGRSRLRSDGAAKMPQRPTSPRPTRRLFLCAVERLVHSDLFQLCRRLSS